MAEKTAKRKKPTAAEKKDLREIVKASPNGKRDIQVGRFVLQSTGLQIKGKVTRAEWERCGVFLARAEGSVHWWIGDWLKVHRGEWGDMYTEAVSLTGFSNSTLRDDKSIADEFHLSRRRDNLTWGHHRVVMGMDDDEQEEWLDIAERDGLSVAKLRAEIRAAENAKALQNLAEAEQGYIVEGDAMEFLRGIEDFSVDLLLTDPPYMTDVEDIEAFAAEWIPLALQKVKLTGRAYIFTGAYARELAAYIAAITKCGIMELTTPLVWTFRNTLGPAPASDYKNNWQACFYLRGKDAPPLNCPIMLEQFSVQDIPAPDGRFEEGRFHPWEKPGEIAERFLRHSTEAGQFAIDPFAGTGTFIAAALRLGRKAVGCERDPKMLDFCRKRGLSIHETGSPARQG